MQSLVRHPRRGGEKTAHIDPEAAQKRSRFYPLHNQAWHPTFMLDHKTTRVYLIANQLPRTVRWYGARGQFFVSLDTIRDDKDHVPRLMKLYGIRVRGKRKLGSAAGSNYALPALMGYGIRS